MSQLTPTSLYATIRYLGINQDGEDLSTNAIDSIEVNYTGFVGDSHSGLTRSSCVRVAKQYPKKTEIRNVRQISALSAEEIEQIAERMGIERLEPGWVGSNVVVSGIHDFSKVPPSSRLIAENGTSLVVDMENAPCKFPGLIIDKYLPGQGSTFAKSALGKRGVTLWVEREGVLSVGDVLRLHVPPVCDWVAS